MATGEHIPIDLPIDYDMGCTYLTFNHASNTDAHQPFGGQQVTGDPTIHLHCALKAHVAYQLGTRGNQTGLAAETLQVGLGLVFTPHGGLSLLILSIRMYGSAACRLRPLPEP